LWDVRFNCPGEQLRRLSQAILRRNDERARQLLIAHKCKRRERGDEEATY